MTDQLAPAGYAPRRHRRRMSERRKLAVTLAATLTVGVVAGTATWSAWTTETDNSGNTFSTAVVQLSDNDIGAEMFALPGMEPGTTTSRCIRVDYDGTRAAEVRLHGAATAGDGLEDYLDLTVTRGVVSSGPFGDCTNFTADATDYTGNGAGVLFDGVMSAYPADWNTGLADPNAAWADGESHYYMFTIEVVDDNNAQGKNVTQTFAWEAH